MPQLAIHLLGPFQVTLDSQPVTGFAYDKVRALLAYLAMEADHFHRRETLATLFWPDHPPKLARQNLRQSLATLRRAINDQNVSPPFLLIDGDTVQFNFSDHTWLDVAAFRTYLGSVDISLRWPKNAPSIRLSPTQGAFLSRFRTLSTRRVYRSVRNRQMSTEPR